MKKQTAHEKVSLKKYTVARLENLHGFPVKKGKSTITTSGTTCVGEN